MLDSPSFALVVSIIFLLSPLLLLLLSFPPLLLLLLASVFKSSAGLVSTSKIDSFSTGVPNCVWKESCELLAYGGEYCESGALLGTRDKGVDYSGLYAGELGA